MNKHLKIGILRETKNPPDRRVALPPKQAKSLLKRNFNIEIYVQSSDIRCFSDDEYRELGIPVVNDVSFCDVLIGVKEVDVPALQSDKKYFFFSHTTKEQPYNRDLLKEILNKNITLVDYELLTNDSGKRLIAFSRWAGIIGCYNGLIAYGKKHNLFVLKPASELKNILEMFGELDKVELPPLKIAITGHGRAGKGAAEVLNYLMVTKVSASKFVSDEFDHPVFTILDPRKYVKRNDGKTFTLDNFFTEPQDYKSVFKKYSDVTDLLVSCHYWDPTSPVLFTNDDILSDDFKISVVADVTCDIQGSLPTTLRPSTIIDPVYGYCPKEQVETSAFKDGVITVMAVDNLPGELPRDASEDFGNKLYKKIIPLLIKEEESETISRATIASAGKLTERYSYLKDYVNG
jgi:saccharopine dehydrogenase (NAD+, L-lysine forming)